MRGDLGSPVADVRLDVTDIEFGDSTFDVVIIPFDRDRALTFEDRAVAEPADRERGFGQRDHVRIYGHDSVERLSDAGFEVSVDRYDEELDDRRVALHGLRPEEIFHCRKAPGLAPRQLHRAIDECATP